MQSSQCPLDNIPPVTQAETVSPGAAKRPLCLEVSVLLKLFSLDNIPPVTPAETGSPGGAKRPLCLEVLVFLKISSQSQQSFQSFYSFIKLITDINRILNNCQELNMI